MKVSFSEEKIVDELNSYESAADWGKLKSRENIVEYRSIRKNHYAGRITLLAQRRFKYDSNKKIKHADVLNFSMFRTIQSLKLENIKRSAK